MSRGIAAFIDGLVGGMEKRRQWDQQDEDRSAAAEERRLNRSAADEKMSRLRTVWQQQDQDRLTAAQDRERDEADRRRKKDREDLLWKREDEDYRRAQGERQILADTYTAARASHEKSVTEAKADLKDQAAVDALAELQSARGAGQGMARESISPTGRTRSIMEPDRDGPRRRAAESFVDHYDKNFLPKIAEQYLARGEPDKAKAWQALNEDAGFRRGKRAYGEAAYYASIGNEDGFLDSLADAYNNQSYLGDNIEVDRKQSGFKKDKAGNIVGGRVTFKDLKTGETYVQELGSENDLYRLGLGILSPEAVFERGLGMIAAEDAAAAEDAKEERKHERSVALKWEEAKIKALGKDPSAERVKDLDSMLKALIHGDLDFASLPPEEQIARAVQLLELRDAALGRGGGVSPGRTVQGGAQIKPQPGPLGTILPPVYRGQ